MQVNFIDVSLDIWETDGLFPALSDWQTSNYRKQWPLKGISRNDCRFVHSRTSMMSFYRLLKTFIFSIKLKVRHDFQNECRFVCLFIEMTRKSCIIAAVNMKKNSFEIHKITAQLQSKLPKHLIHQAGLYAFSLKEQRNRSRYN